jgi:hypothetical protein
MYFCNNKKCKNCSLFSTVAILAKFSTICQVGTTMVPEKGDVIKLGQFAEKHDGECWQFAQRLWDHFQIAAVTARYGKG